MLRVLSKAPPPSTTKIFSGKLGKKSNEKTLIQKPETFTFYFICFQGDNRIEIQTLFTVFLPQKSRILDREINSFLF